eukprot:gene45328-56457_t
MRYSGAEIAARNTLLMATSAKSNPLSPSSSGPDGNSPMHTSST